jgi:uncharacterized protein (DUF1778 family)
MLLCGNQESIMSTSANKQERIGARVPTGVYKTLNRAAALTGATVNQFLVQSALKEAKAIIAREEQISLTAEDWLWLTKLLDDPPKTKVTLKNAKAKYHKAKASNADSSFDWRP